MDGLNIFNQIKADSQRRRANPHRFLIEFLEEIWRNSSQEEALEWWEHVVTPYYPWYVEDVLFCLDAMLASPPENLVVLIEDHGWIDIYPGESDANGYRQPYTLEEVVQWLRQRTEEFRTIYSNPKSVSITG